MRIILLIIFLPLVFSFSLFNKKMELTCSCVYQEISVGFVIDYKNRTDSKTKNCGQNDFDITINTSKKNATSSRFRGTLPFEEENNNIKINFPYSVGNKPGEHHIMNLSRKSGKLKESLYAITGEASETMITMLSRQYICEESKNLF